MKGVPPGTSKRSVRCRQQRGWDVSIDFPRRSNAAKADDIMPSASVHLMLQAGPVFRHDNFGTVITRRSSCQTHCRTRGWTQIVKDNFTVLTLRREVISFLLHVAFFSPRLHSPFDAPCVKATFAEDRASDPARVTGVADDQDRNCIGPRKLLSVTLSSSRTDW